MKTSTASNAQLESLKERMLEAVEKGQFENSKHLIACIQEKTGLSHEEIATVLITLENEGKIHFQNTESKPNSYFAFVTLNKAAWYWMTVAFTALTLTIVLFIPSNLLFAEDLRILIGGIFLAVLPGYSLLRLLFPRARKPSDKTTSIDLFERFALSLGLSLVIAPLAGLMLNYTPWGITLVPITVVLVVLTLIFATAASGREYQIANSPRSST